MKDLPQPNLEEAEFLYPYINVTDGVRIKCNFTNHAIITEMRKKYGSRQVLPYIMGGCNAVLREPRLGSHSRTDDSILDHTGAHVINHQRSYGKLVGLLLRIASGEPDYRLIDRRYSISDPDMIMTDYLQLLQDGPVDLQWGMDVDWRRAMNDIPAMAKSIIDRLSLLADDDPLTPNY